MSAKQVLSRTGKRGVMSRLLLLLVLLALSACGDVEIGIEATPTARSAATPAPTATAIEVPSTPTSMPLTATPTTTPTRAPTATPTETPAATATPERSGAGDWKTYSDAELGISLEYPANWQFDAVHGGVKYGAEDGFFILDAIGSPGESIDQVAATQAGHHLRPYGTQPTIESLEVAGQEARLILPSADATMGDQAMLIVRYPQPRMIGSSDHAYEFLVVYADQAHIRDIAHTLQFLEPGT
jgi:hypothetical protein